MSLAFLEAGRALLRPLAPSDAGALHVAYADPEVCVYWSRPAYTRLEETQGALAWEIANGKSWVILDAAGGGGGEALGRVSLFPGRSPGVLEAGIIMVRAAWGRGLAGEALGALVRHGFGALDAHRIFADIDPDNTASIRLFERAGFAREGLLRQAWRTHLGLRDSVILGRLRDGSSLGTATLRGARETPGSMPDRG